MNYTMAEAIEEFNALISSAWGEGDREIASCRHDPALARNLECLRDDHHNLRIWKARAIEVMKYADFLLNLAFSFEGDVFGVEHNNAMDTSHELEVLLTEFRQEMNAT